MPSFGAASRARLAASLHVIDQLLDLGYGAYAEADFVYIISW